MIYAARSVFLLGTGLMCFGLLWAIAIWKNAIELLPDFWDQPVTALALSGIGFGITTLGKKMGGDPNGDDVPVIEGLDLSRIWPRSKAAPEKPKTNTDRLRAYDEMIEDAPAEIHQAGRPMAKAQPVATPATPAEKSELIAELLGVKPKRAQANPTAQIVPQPAMDAALPASVVAPHVDFHKGRTRLEVAFPQRETDSWIGGGPSMPAGMAWPQIDGKPASFYAQIALTDLPDDIWGGIGPRSGWLIFFGADDPSAQAIVLHSPERGSLRIPPVEADHYFQNGSGEEALAELIGPEALQPPRWYLEAVEDKGGARPDLGQASPSQNLLQKPTMTDPGLLPFDWPTAFALLDSAEAMVQRMLERARTQASQGDEAAQAQAQGMTETLARLQMITEKFEARAEVAAFDDKACARLIGALAKTTNAGWLSAKALAEGRKPRSLLQFQGYAPYRKLYEAQARRVYCADPGALPEATMNRLMPLWQEQARVEAIFIGNAPGEDLPQDAPCLLVLPSSELAGWQIGDLSRWAVQIAPEALAQGRFEAVLSENSHGQVWDSQGG